MLSVRLESLHGVSRRTFELVGLATTLADISDHTVSRRSWEVSPSAWFVRCHFVRNGYRESVRQLYLQVPGEFDEEAGARLRDQTRAEIDQSEGDVLLDCRAVWFLDWDGLVPLLEAQALLRARNRTLVLFNLRAAPRRKLELLGLYDFLTAGSDNPSLAHMPRRHGASADLTLPPR